MKALMFLLFGIGAVQGVRAASVTDPIADYFQRTDKAVYRPSMPGFYEEDQLFRFDVDLNNDGKKEVLISSSQDADGRQGNVFYLYRESQGGFERAGDLLLPPNGIYVGAISEVGYGILKYWPSGGGEGGYSAYVFDGKHITDKPLGPIVRNRISGKLEGTGIEIAAKYVSSVPDSIHDQVEAMRVEKAYSPALLTKIVTPSHVYSMKELTQTYGLDIEKSSFKKSAQALSKEISEASPSSSLLPSATPSPSIKATASTSFPIIPVSALMVLLAAVVIYLVRQKEL